MARQIKQILDSFYNGDSLTDKDLLALHDHTLQTADYLSHMGDRFRLACTEALHISDTCAGYIQARENDRFIKDYTKDTG